eukprot:m.814038 g.814038  ORF g.814038 m.814038 type:complete len:66 (-) comp23392_c0_seq6:1517-1714(-)
MQHDSLVHQIFPAKLSSCQDSAWQNEHGCMGAARTSAAEGALVVLASNQVEIQKAERGSDDTERY